MAPRADGGGPDPDERVRPVQARVLRAEDLIDLRIEAPNCHLEPEDPPAEIVADNGALLIVHFPPQHLAEQAFLALSFMLPENGDVDTTAAPLPGVARHRAAEPTRLVFEVPEGTRIPFTLAGVLDAATKLRLRVHPNALPAPTADGPPPPTGMAPAPPADDQTAIEAPYRLVVSPSEHGAFTHSLTPVGPERDGGRPDVELWRSHLTVRPDDEGTVDDGQRIVRAVWSPDLDNGAAEDPWASEESLYPPQRRRLVNLTYGGQAGPAAAPLRVDDLALSSLGAWLDWAGSWPRPAPIVDYRHVAIMGRDAYVRVVQPGFWFPCGHRAVLVQVTERRIGRRGRPVAHLWQRFFIITRQPTASYDDIDNPFLGVTISPIVTPDIDKPPPNDACFVPTRFGQPLPLKLSVFDKSGRRRSFPAPLVFVPLGERRGFPYIDPDNVIADAYRQSLGFYGPVNQIRGQGQTVAMARPTRAGDTDVEVAYLVFDGDVDRVHFTSRPKLTKVRGIVPAMRHLSPQAPAVDMTYAAPYLAHGLDSPGNPAELVLKLTSPPAAIDFSTGSDRSGGFISPNMQVAGVSRSLGTVGETGDAPGGLTNGQFDPAKFLAGALPKLFGLFSLLDLLPDAPGALSKAPAFVSDTLNGIMSALSEAQRLQSAFQAAQDRMAAEIAGAAHQGASGIAQAAKAKLDAHAGIVDAAQDVVTAASAIPPNPAGLSGSLTTLAAGLGGLLDDLRTPGFPAALRSSLEKPVRALRTLAQTAGDLAQLAQVANLTARMEWRPVIESWGLPGVDNIFAPTHPDNTMALAVEVRAATGGQPAVDVMAELVDFALNLVGDGDTALMRLVFQRIGFHAGSSGKPEIDVVFGKLEFLGPLAFVDKLRSLIPFDGFSDPPYVEVTGDGATAGFDLALPNLSVGVFSLENIALGADARIPFLGDAVTVGFYFCAKESPFRLTVMCIGGGGWVELRASPKGLVLLEVGLEAAACLSIDLGVASGSVSIAVGVYLRLEADKGSLTAYFRIRGEVDVLGLISASITLELSLKYDFDTGKLVGRASLVVEIEILFFSASVEITCERRLAGSKGDPTLRQIMPPVAGMNDDWARYCAAFAPVP
jgi:hypothetical protein